MRYDVVLTIGAARDLAEIRADLIETEAVEGAERVITELKQVMATLAEMPNRGNAPKELSFFGASGFRELHHKTYRIIYTVEGREVSILAIADSRRDMQGFLFRHLIR